MKAFAIRLYQCLRNENKSQFPCSTAAAFFAAIDRALAAVAVRAVVFPVLLFIFDVAIAVLALVVILLGRTLAKLQWLLIDAAT